MKNQVRTVFLGDRMVFQKYSLMDSPLWKDIDNQYDQHKEFQEGLPDVIEEVAIPNEFTISHVPLFLDDSSGFRVSCI